MSSQQECWKTWAQPQLALQGAGVWGWLCWGLDLLPLPRPGAPALWAQDREGGSCSGNGHSGLGFSAEFDHFGEENMQCGLCYLTDLAVGSSPVLSLW